MDNDDFSPTRKKRARGPYTSYNDPSNPNIILPSTSRRHKIRAEERGQPGAARPARLEGRREQQQVAAGGHLPAPASILIPVDQGSSSAAEASADNQTVDTTHMDNVSQSRDDEGASDEAEFQGEPSLLEDEQQQDCLGVCVRSKCKTCDVNNEVDVAEDVGLRREGDPVSGKGRDEWNELLHPGLKVTKFDVALMILHIVIRHGQTGPLVEDLLKFVNAIIGEKVLPTTRYMFSQLFKPAGTLYFHYFCSKCECYIGEKSDFPKNSISVPCPECEELCPVKHTDVDNVFISLSVREQLELLKREDFKIMSHLNRSADFIRDIMDGDLYRSVCFEGKPLSNPDSITITFSTDGVAVFNSSKGSLWPIQFYVNETNPNNRFQPQNVLLAGLYCGKKSPNMSTLLQPFVKELQSLAVEGVKHVKPDGTVIHRPVFAINCALDSVAKPKVVNMKQFNGSCGCGYCLHPNILVTDIKQLRYIWDGVVYPERTHCQMLQDMEKADSLDRQGKLKKSQSEGTSDSVNGVTGMSILLMLPLFHIVYGFGIDYFHVVLEGVMKTLCELWFGPGSEPYCISKLIPSINELIENIKPPHTMMRRPRSLYDRAKWKAREWRAFLLYYVLPCLFGKLPRAYFDNVKCLVKAIYILLSESITPEKLRESSDLLKQFVTEFNSLYGDRYMVYNIHLCTHLSRMVEMYGPLWAYSTFPFESGNGHLIKLFSGTRGVVNQIARKYLTARSVPSYCRRYKVTQGALNFCSEVFTYDYLKNSERCNNVTALGVEVVGDLSHKDILKVHSSKGELFYSARKQDSVF